MTTLAGLGGQEDSPSRWGIAKDGKKENGRVKGFEGGLMIARGVEQVDDNEGSGGKSTEEVGGIKSKLGRYGRADEDEVRRENQNEGPISNGWLARLARSLFFRCEFGSAEYTTGTWQMQLIDYITIAFLYLQICWSFELSTAV